MRLATFAVDSALGRWTHHTWRPPHLAAAVDHLWHFDGAVALPRERTFPGGHLELIVHLGARYREVAASGTAAAPYPLACLTGQQVAPVVIEAPAGTSTVLGIRLRPVGASALLALPLAECTGRTLDLADVVGRAAAELGECCGAARTVEARFRLAAAWIARRLTSGPPPHPAIAWAAAELEARGGIASVSALRAQSGLGRTRFAELFQAQVGLPPKRWARVLRFRRALARLQRGGPLSTAALEAGYYDQAHLTADFREFAGMTPGAFVAATRYHNSPSLAEPG